MIFDKEEGRKKRREGKGSNDPLGKRFLKPA
jgi:hypothetical protein